MLLEELNHVPKNKTLIYAVKPSVLAFMEVTSIADGTEF